jgi:hypothetical protein
VSRSASIAISNDVESWLPFAICVAHVTIAPLPEATAISTTPSAGSSARAAPVAAGSRSSARSCTGCCASSVRLRLPSRFPFPSFRTIATVTGAPPTSTTPKL